MADKIVIEKIGPVKASRPVTEKIDSYIYERNQEDGHNESQDIFHDDFRVHFIL